MLLDSLDPHAQDFKVWIKQFEAKRRTGRGPGLSQVADAPALRCMRPDAL